MEFVIAVFMAIVAFAMSYISLDRGTAEKIKLFAAADSEEEYISKVFSRTKIIVMSVLLMVVTFVSSRQILDRVSSSNGEMKMLLALVCMIGAACFDFREHRIPNIFPLVMAVGAVILLLLGVVMNIDGAVDYITTNVIAAVGCAIVLAVSALLTKQGIGAGDIKLISALAFLTGVYTVMGTLFFGVIGCAIYAVFALIMKKKKMSSGVPFGPFLLLGYIISLFAISF